MRAINLLPKDDKRRAGASKPPSAVVLTAAIGAVVVTALLCGLFLLSHGKVTQKQATLDGLQRELGAIPKPATDQVQRTDALVADKQARITALNGALARRVAWDRVLREFAMVLPDDVWLITLTGSSPTLSTSLTGPTATSSSSGSSAASAATTGVQAPPGAATDTDVMFSVEGYTYSQNGVARLLSRLQVIPDFEHIQLLSSERATVGGRSVFHFRVGADIRQPGGGS
jgi:Tfp pilus assembly protein PilN